MDFRLKPEQEAFREEVRQFLSREWRPCDPIWTFHAQTDEDFEEGVAFEKKLAVRGWLTMAWPKEYGGLGLDQMMQVIFREECTLVGAPTGGGGIGTIGPCIMIHGSEAQKQRFLPAIARAEVRFCQGFSEPGAGSDLASLQTRATRDGDDYVINGQKIWTTAAQWSDWIHVLARTDPDAPKHRGISYFLVDMKTPGVSVQPIVQMTGRTGFNQTFFDNVRVPRENMLGEENRGWYIAATTLDFERSGMERLGTAAANVRRLVEYARETRVDGRRLIEKPGIGPMLADLAAAAEVGRLLCYRVAWLQSQGKVPNYEASMAKAYASDLIHKVSQAGMRLVGLYGQLGTGSPHAPLDGFFCNIYVGSVPATISAGTNEIQRNIIAQRGLGLPR